MSVFDKHRRFSSVELGGIGLALFLIVVGTGMVLFPTPTSVWHPISVESWIGSLERTGQSETRADGMIATVFGFGLLILMARAITARRREEKANIEEECDLEKLRSDARRQADAIPHYESATATGCFFFAKANIQHGQKDKAWKWFEAGIAALERTRRAGTVSDGDEHFRSEVAALLEIVDQPRAEDGN